jgi:hypothetical protein
MELHFGYANELSIVVELVTMKPYTPIGSLFAIIIRFQHFDNVSLHKRSRSAEGQQKKLTEDHTLVNNAKEKCFTR